MIGFIYRRAVAIKEFGERYNLSRLIRLGLWMRDWVSNFPVIRLG
jgi:hypothetical protein